MTTDRKKKALETRQKLLDTALKLFAKRGFEHVSIAQITTTCGVSKGTFYTHFATKYDIVLEKFQEFDTHYVEAAKKIDASLSPPQKIIALYDEQMIYLTTVVGKDIMRTVYTAAMTNQVEHVHYLIHPQRTIFELIRRYLEEGVEQNIFRKDLSFEAIEKMIQRAMRANVYDWLIHAEDFDLIKEMHVFTTTLLDGIRA